MKKNIMNQNNNEAIENILSLTKDEFIRHDVVEDCIDPYTQKPLLNGDETPMEKYQKFKNANFDYDADVSIQAMCVAREAYSALFEEGGDKDGWYFHPQDDYDYKYNKERLKFEIKNDSKTYTYRGDTMNTIATTLGEFRRIFGTTAELPEEADRLTDLYHTFGNFMLLPYRSGVSINRLRGIKESHDYFDLFLLAVYHSYYMSEDPAENTWKMVDILGENSRALTLFFEYLGQIYGFEKYSGWNHFIEYNFLQDYVEINPDGSYGKPKELWTGHFTGDVMPKTMDEFKQFWKNAADRILARGARIYEKLHGHDESCLNGLNKYAGKMQETKIKRRIMVVGVGDAGCHAVNRMMDEEMEGVEFIGVNTDKQALQSCKAPGLLRIGARLTGGLDVGARPEIGERAAKESAEEISATLNGADMVLIVCGMGGGTGTGAAPVVAKLAKDMGILTVGVVTLPFSFEKRACMFRAQVGIECIREFADTLIVLPGDSLLQGKGRNTNQMFAFRKMNKALQQTVQRVLNAFNENDVIGLDFTHIEWIMKPRGMAQVGLGEGQGNEKALNAVQRAAKGIRLDTALTENMRIIIHVSGDVDLKDASYAIDYVQKLAGEKVNIAFGARYDNSIADHCVVTVIAKFLEDVG